MKWKIVTIKSISKQIRGVSYTPKDVSSIPLEGHIRLLRANNITESGIDLSDTVFVNQKCISESQKLKVGDILIAASSGSIKIVGKAILIEDEINSSFGAFCKVIRPSENVDYRYLSYYFRSSDYRQKISHLAAGANINNLRNEDLDNLEIPLPPLPTQKRIAEILDAADALRRKDQELLRKYDELAQAIFIDMFGDPVKNEKGWEVKEFGDYIDYIGDIGSNGSNEVVAKNLNMLDSEDFAIMIRTTNLAKNDFTSNVKYVSEKTYNFFKKSKIYGGEIIMNKIGSAGDFWIMPNLNKPVSLGLNQLVIRLKGLNTKFIYYYLSTDYGKSIIKSSLNGAVTKSITKSAVKALPILYPEIKLQEKFELLLSNIDAEKEKLNNSVINSNLLFNSLLQQAFKGELVKYDVWF